MRELDKGTDWRSLQGAISQALTISIIGYPFVETDMIGGSDGPPPDGLVLVRWAEAAALMPLMYASTLPTSPIKTTETKKSAGYDLVTLNLYRAALLEHKALAPYIWKRAQDAVRTGAPIMKPLFFDFPGESATYQIDDQWLLGDAIMAAPILTNGTVRQIYVPSGVWYDVKYGTRIIGPTTLPQYRAPLDTVPVFVRLGIAETAEALAALSKIAKLAFVTVALERAATE